MRLLLDTQALIWALNASPRLAPAARAAVADRANEILVSAVSGIEVTTKYRLGKLPDAAVLATDFLRTILAADYVPLPVSVEHAALAGSLDITHRDPFDRLLIAQARIEGVALVSNEAMFDGYGVGRLW